MFVVYCEKLEVRQGQEICEIGSEHPLFCLRSHFPDPCMCPPLKEVVLEG